jgi:hypothetical protein
MNGSIRPRTTHTAACSGSTATPATGTNDTKPKAAAAINAITKASVEQISAAMQMRATARPSRRTNATALRTACDVPASSTTSTSWARR